MNALASLTRTPERRIAFALLLLCAALYFPFAGNYGLWDPWETHYSEVARQMLMRHDYVSLWWPGSPQDRNEFWSKPVLTFWLMAMGMAVTGLQRVGHAFDGEMAVGWTAEWSVRVPFILCGIACVWATWELTRRLAGRRAGMWAAIVLATASQFFYVTRQAMTDMAFVAPIAVALCFGGLAMMLPDEEIGVDVPRRSAGWFGWPHVPIYYVQLAMVLLVAVPQLLICSIQTHLAFTLGRHAIRMTGLVGMLPWIAALGFYLWVSAGARNRRQIYLHIAYLMCALSTLAKGPAGVGLPVIVIFIFLLAQGQWRKLLPTSSSAAPGHGFMSRLVHHYPVELVAGVLLFAAVACPWYHAMLIKHGMGFWNEFIGDNYVHRAAGRHGDRGTFEYYILQIGHGMYPWTGFIAASLLAAVGRLRAQDQRGKLRIFALTWFLVMFVTMSVVNTKFHHYILPGLPALAILAGLFIDDLVARPSLSDAGLLSLVGVPMLALAARDLSKFPARLLWLFDYDYVNAPNGGRPWPPGAEYDYTNRLAWWGVVVTAATAIFAIVSLIRAWQRARLDEHDGDAGSIPPAAVWALVVIPIGATAAAELWQPKFDLGPHPLANGWILVGGLAGALLLTLLLTGLSARPPSETSSTERRGSATGVTLALALVGVVACFWTGWGLDRLLTDVSPHWSQKHVIASYYKLRSGPEEPLIAWQMYWRGENFYTKNVIYDHTVDQREKTVFLGDHNAEKMQEYFKNHPGRRIFFIVERTRFESLRGLLPEAARASLHSVDDTNNKIYLGVAQL